MLSAQLSHGNFCQYKKAAVSSPKTFFAISASCYQQGEKFLCSPLHTSSHELFFPATSVAEKEHTSQTLTKELINRKDKNLISLFPMAASGEDSLRSHRKFELTFPLMPSVL